MERLRQLVATDGNGLASENHGLVAQGEVPSAPLSSISAPTLIIHGTADPMFPLEHGQALADEIGGARLRPSMVPVTASSEPTGRRSPALFSGTPLPRANCYSWCPQT
jgi:pimeloyl-ACP methyl ester carboxylesterase